MSKPITQDLVHEFFIACMEASKYNFGLKRTRIMESKAAALFEILEGRKPTRKEIAEMTTY